MMTHKLFHRVQLTVLFLICFCIISRAQTNLFTTANIANTTISPTPSYGAASDLFDGDDYSYVFWTVVPTNITIQLKQAAKIGYYSMSFFSDGYSPQNVTLSGSNDNLNWVQLDSRSANDFSTLTASFANSQAFTYYRYTLTGFNTSEYNILLVNELSASTSLPAPTVPTLSALAGNVGTFNTLSWNSTVSANSNIFSGYEIQRSLDGSNYSLLASVLAPNTSYTDTTTVQSTSYWYRIRSRVDTIFSAYSSGVKVTSASDSLKTAPTLNIGVRNGLRVSLSWNNIINTGGTYELYKSTDSVKFDLLKTFDKSVTSYTDTLSDTLNSSFYKVRGVDYISNSPYSNIVKVSDQLTTAPVISVATGTIGTVARISWTFTTSSSTYQYNLERSTDSINFSSVARPVKGTLAYSDSSLKTATKYFYRIQANNNISTSPYSNIARITTLTDSLKTAPILSASSTSGTQAQLSWTYTFPTNIAAGFEILQSMDSITFISLGKVDKSITSFSVQSLMPNTKYWFKVRAYNYLGNSLYSNVPSVTTNNIYATADITYDGGKLFVNAENSTSNVISANNAEGSSKLIDHNISTKFLVFTAQLSGTLNCIYKPTGQYIVTSYGVGTAGDAAARDPKNWTFAGSNDSTTWVTLDTRTNQLGTAASRSSYYYYNIAAPGTVAYKYYRLSITTNNGATDGVRFQIAEWPIYGTSTSAPNIPQNLKVSDSTANSLSLTWTQDTSDTKKYLTNFVLQRGLDQLSFVTINSKIPASTRSFTEQGLLDSTNYYYRIQAVDSVRSSSTGWSTVAAGKTKVTPGIPHIPILSLGAVTDSSINISWTNRATDAIGFKIERSTNGVDFVQIDSVLLAKGTTYTNYPVWPAYVYYYRIRAYNSNGNSNYSNVISTITTGYNHAPVANNPIIYRKVCTGVGTYKFSFDGIAPGPNYESSQQLKVRSVASDTAHAKLFTAFSFDSTINNGVVNYSFTTSNAVASGDSATILVTIKDNGGVTNAGVDSIVVPVKIYFGSLNISVAADKNLIAIPRYALVTLTATSSDPTNTSYAWTSSNAEDIVGANNLVQLQVRPLKTETITVTGTTSQGCTASALITLKPQDSLVVANILTPNGDGKNDKWIIWGIENVNNNNVKVVDRSGRVVFTQNNYLNNWDGRYNGSYVPEGAYYYVVEYTISDEKGGTSKIQKRGVLTVIRGN